jgi:hypothetical protein
MSDQTHPSDPSANTARVQRVVTTLALAAPILWQAYVAVSAFRVAKELGLLLSGFGASLPFVTRSFLATHRGWIVVPVLFLGLSLDLLRRPHPRPLYVGAVLGSSLLAALVMEAWLQQALFAPLFSILEKIG